MQSVHVYANFMYMKSVREHKRNTVEVLTEMDQGQVLNISQARPLFSQMVNRVEERPFFIGNRRGIPLAMLVSYKKAREYLPKRYLVGYKATRVEKSPIEMWWDSYNTWLTSQPKRKKRTINISENVDQYIYK